MLDDVVPNLLIGLREGLEAGLIISILIACLVRADQRGRLGSVWAGVLAAIVLSLGFGAVLTFAAANLSTRAQEAFSGVLGVVAVVFVTAMIFWMRGAAKSLSREIKEKVATALTMGGGVLALTAFLAVAREGLETSLFLWTSTQTATETTGPLIGAVIGLLLAAALCWALYRRVLKLNLTRFFTLTGAALIVIAAGIFGYAIRDLQESGALPGAHALAFDVSAVLRPGAWYQRLLEGTLNVTPTMTVLQVVAYLAYLIPVLFLFFRGARGRVGAAPAAAPATTPASAPAAVPATAPASAPAAVPATAPASAPAAAEGVRAGRRRLVIAGAVAVPVALTITALVVLGPKQTAGTPTIEVAASSCAAGWSAPTPGPHSFPIHNGAGTSAEIYLLDPASGAVYGEIERLGPGATRILQATLGPGSYAWRCIPDGIGPITSQIVSITGGPAGARAVVPVTEEDLAGAVTAYRAEVATGLDDLVTKTDALVAATGSGDADRAKDAWLRAHLTYETLGAAYGTFEDFDKKINGRPDGLPGKANDPEFTGFLRVEHGLWHGESLTALTPVVARLDDDVRGLRDAFPTQQTDPSILPLRAHEILENTLQFELTGDTDQGSGTNLATASANLSGTRMVLDTLRPILLQRNPSALADADTWLNRTAQALDSLRPAQQPWPPVDALTRAQRQELNGTLGQTLEVLAAIPTTLEIRHTG